MTRMEEALTEHADPTVVIATEAVAEVFSDADGRTDRAHKVQDLNDGLVESGLILVDVESDLQERKGVNTKLTRTQLLGVLAMQRYRASTQIARMRGGRALY